MQQLNLDLSTNEKIEQELAKIHENAQAVIKDLDNDYNQIRNFILDYYTEYYEFVRVIEPNIYCVYYI